MIANDHITVENGLLTKTGTLKKWCSVVSNYPLPIRGILQFEVEFVNIGEIESRYNGLQFGITNIAHSITTSIHKPLSAIMFNASSDWRGRIFHNGNDEQNFLKL